jgi:hypothetical protein
VLLPDLHIKTQFCIFKFHIVQIRDRAIISQPIKGVFSFGADHRTIVDLILL